MSAVEDSASLAPSTMAGSKKNLIEDYNTFQEEPQNEEEHNGEEFTVDEAIERIGFGKFQLLLAVAAGFAWVADGMEMMVISIISPVLACDWTISVWQRAFLTTAVFAGYTIGTPFFGWFADTYGRKQSLFFCSAWIAFFGVLCAFAPFYSWLAFLRFLVGFGVGGSAQVCTYYMEFLPRKSRSKVIMCIQFFWAFGGTLEVCLAMLVMGKYGWRLWLALTAIPSCLFLLVAYWAPPSPRYLMSIGDRDGTHRVLLSAAILNGEKLPPGQLVPEKIVPRGHPRDLVSTPLLARATIMTFILWFLCAIVYVGAQLINTEFIALGGTCQQDVPLETVDDPDIDEACSQAECLPLSQQEYLAIMYTTFSELPALVILGVLSDLVGRRFSMAGAFFLFAIVWLVLNVCMQGLAMNAVLFSTRGLGSALYQLLHVYIVEIHPTQVRSLGIGIAASLGRVGSLITPYFAQVLFDVSHFATLAVYAGVCLVAGALCIALPIETKGQPLLQAGEVSNDR